MVTTENRPGNLIDLFQNLFILKFIILVSSLLHIIINKFLG